MAALRHFSIITLVILTILLKCFAQVIIPPKVKLNDDFKKQLGYPEEIYLDFANEAKSKGYNSEEHFVATEDGYILKIFRMNDPKCESYHKVPVMLQHGTAVSSESFLVSGEDTALGYLLAKSCFDVWAGSWRGDSYGRNHTTLNPDTDFAFWDFGTDEMIAYDNPAIVDYILKATSAEKVNLIGYSLGGGTTILLLAENPGYNAKIGTVVGLSPAILVKNLKSIPFAIVFRLSQILETFFPKTGIMVEMLEKDSLIQTSVELLCQSGLVKRVCETLLGVIDNFHSDSVSAESIRKIYSVIFMGFSRKIGAHLQQWIDNGAIAKYDYGSEENLILYGSETPLEYDLNNVQVPVLLVSGESDNFVMADNVRELGALLPNAVTHIVNDPHWNHADMLFSKNFPELVYPIVLEHLEAYSD